MNHSARQWIVGVLTTVLVVGGLVACNAGDEAGTSTPATETARESSTSASSSSSSTSTTSSVTSTTAPKGTVPAGTAPTPAVTISDCTTWSLTSINDVRAGVGLGALSLMSDAKACAWAHQLAVNGTLSHDSADCGFQVAGYVGNTAQPVNANAPASIITNWFNSRSNDYDNPKHYEILTWPAVSKIALAFVTATSPDGSWRVYGVGNLCP